MSAGIFFIHDGDGRPDAPVVHPPLHSYGRTDATHRYVADRLEAALGELVDRWPDQIGEADLTTLPTEQPALIVADGPAGVGKAVAQQGIVLTGAARHRLTAPKDPQTRTVIMVTRTPTVESTRVLFEQGEHRWRVARVGNGQISTGPFSGTGGSGQALTGWSDGWDIVAGSYDPASGIAAIKRHGQAQVTAPITVVPTGTLDAIGEATTASRDTEWAEVLTFDSVLTAAQCEAVMQALAEHYTL